MSATDATLVVLRGVAVPSSAVTVLVDLQAAGFTVFAENEWLVVRPKSRITAALDAAIKAHRDPLLAVVRSLDDGVRARVTVFARQLRESVPPTCPAFLFRAGVPYVAGRCFSCGEALERLRFGRCSKCALAWRLAAGVSIPRDLADAVDAAKAIA